MGQLQQVASWGLHFARCGDGGTDGLCVVIVGAGGLGALTVVAGTHVERARGVGEGDTGWGCGREETRARA